MKKLGLVGGMGPESTIPYYHDIVYGVQKRVGKDFFPNLSIESVNVFEVLRLCREEKYKELTEYLMKAIQNLINSGADFVEATRDEAFRLNKRRIGLIGTVFTMTGEFFKKPFQEKGIEIIIPTKEEMEYINEKISSELELGIVKEDTLQGFQKIINRMKEEDRIEAIILGCTELPLLLNDDVEEN